MNPMLPKKILLFLFCVPLFIGLQGQDSDYSIVKGDTLTFEYYSFPFAPFKATAQNGKAQYKRIDRGSYQLTYVPNDGFTGLDTIIYDRWNNSSNYLWEQIVVEVQNSLLLLENDIATLQKGASIELDVLANDFSTAGGLKLAGIPISSNGNASVTNNKISFDPSDDFEGFTYLSYVACDAQENCATATVSLLVEGDKTKQSESFELFTTQGKTLTFPLPSNSLGIDNQPSNGAVFSLNALTNEYTPNEGFVGVDTFTLRSNDLVYTYIVTVLSDNAFKSSGTAKDDRVYTTLNKPIEIDVRRNDIGSYRIINFTQPRKGTVAFKNGKLEFTPAPFFTGSVTFEYSLGFLTNTVGKAQVTVVVGNQDPSLDMYQLSTLKNLPKIIRYPATISNFAFKTIESPNQGTLQYYEGYQEIMLKGQLVSGTNMLVYTPNPDFAGDDVFEIQYCVDNNCTNIEIEMEVQDMEVDNPCLTDCVWPGDGNYDGVVNMYDLLDLAQNLGKIGANRDNSIEWYGQNGETWNDDFTRGGFDFKHLDMNGDGIASVADTAAIAANYNKTHNLTNEILTNKTDNVPFILDYKGPSKVSVGDTIYYEMILGTASNPATNFKGLVSFFNFNPKIFNDDFLKVEFYDNAWPSYYGTILHMEKSPWIGRLDIGYTLPTVQAIAGFGAIGQVGIVIDEDIAGIKDDGEFTTTIEMVTNVSLGSQMVSKSQLIPITIQFPENVPIVEEKTLDIKVYPNPIQHEYIIESNEIITQIEIYSVSGQLIAQKDGFNTKKVTEKVGNLPNGLYFAKVFTENGFKTNKIQIVR